MKSISVRIEPYGIGVSNKYEAGYVGITIDKDYQEYTLSEGEAIIGLMKLIKKLQKKS